MRAAHRLLPWLAVAAIVVVADQLSKTAILALLSAGDELRVAPFFNIVLAYNEGAAFGFLDSQPGWQRYFFTGVAIAVSAFIIHLLRKEAPRTVSIALALILGGAVGNAIDRIAYGHVVDFLDFHVSGMHFYAFNVADIGICVGAFLIAVHELFPGSAARNSSNKEQSIER